MYVNLSRSKFKYILDIPIIFSYILEGKIDRFLELKISPEITEYRAVYQRDKFNEFGDEIGHLNLESMDPNKMSDIGYIDDNAQLNQKTNDYLSDLVNYLKSKDVIVFYDFPSGRLSNFINTDNNKFDEVIDALKKIKGLIILSTPLERCYADNLFFDDYYHLNAEGRELRTKDLITAIKQYIH